MNLAQFMMKNYDKLEFISAVKKIMILLQISEIQAFRMALEQAKKKRLKTGFLKIYPDAWIQYTKFIKYNNNYFSYIETLEITENKEFTE